MQTTCRPQPTSRVRRKSSDEELRINSAAHLRDIADELDGGRPKKKRSIVWGHSKGRRPKARTFVVPYL